jgi:hypothetical protein
MLIFSACDEGFGELFGPVLKASAEANGHECLIVSSGKRATDQDSRAWHSTFRYRVLPDLLRVHPSILMLDTDSIVRKPVKIEPWVETAMIVRLGKDDNQKINGSAVYLTQKALPAAEWLKGRLSGEPKWFDDQLALLALFMKREYRTQVFDERWISWHCDPSAPIWTGKGRVKLSDKWHAEMLRWYPQAHRPELGET